MKSLATAYKTHLAGDLTTLAHLLKLTRTDGVVLALTDHDRDITYGGTTYQSTLAVEASAIVNSGSLAVDNLEAKGFLSLLGISEADIAAGLWDCAEVQLRRVNWADLSQLDEKIKRGWLGQISVAQDQHTDEVRGLTQALQQTIGRMIMDCCDADAFDARCGLNPAPWTVSGSVGSVTVAQRQWSDAALTQADDYFGAGKVHWLTGANAGLDMEVRTFAAASVTLQQAMPYTIVPGDTYTIRAGCRKRFTEDCVGKFGNGDNHRGFPFVPNPDDIYKGP